MSVFYCRVLRAVWFWLDGGRRVGAGFRWWELQKAVGVLSKDGNTVVVLREDVAVFLGAVRVGGCNGQKMIHSL